MAYSFGSSLDAANGGSGTSLGVTSVVLPAGASVAVWVEFDGSTGTTSSVADTLGNVYTPRGTPVNDGGGPTNLRMYTAHGVVGGTTTITASFGATVSFIGLCAAWWTGLYPAAPLDFNLHVDDPNATTTDGVTSGTVTPSSQPAAVIGFSINIDLAATAAGTGFSDRGTAANMASTLGEANRLEDKRVTSTAASAATFTVASSFRSLTAGVVFPETGIPIITQQPGSLAISAGSYWYGQVVATDSTGGGLTYRWQINTGSGFTNISGATSASYASAALTTGNTGTQYRCVVTNSMGSATSSAATVTVVAATVGTLGDFDPELRLLAWF